MAVTRQNDSAPSGIAEAVDKRNPASNQSRADQHERPEIHFNLSAIKRAAPDNVQANALFQPKTWYMPPPQQSVSSLPPPPPSAPSLPFTFIGRMIDENIAVLFLSKNGRQYTVKESDVLDNTYRLEKITDNNAVLTYLPMNIQQTLAFNSTAVGSSTLNASASTTTMLPAPQPKKQIDPPH